MKPLKSIGSVLLLCLASTSHAASIDIVPTSPIDGVLPGDIVSFDIVLDFSEEPTLGGGLDVTFDEDFLALVSFTDTVILGDPAFGRAPDYIPGSGRLESWGVGDFNGISGGLMGQVSFELIAIPYAGTTIALVPYSGFGVSWLSAVDFVTILDPTYGSVTIGAPIPVPAALWFMLSGLGAMFSLRYSAA